MTTAAADLAQFSQLTGGMSLYQPSKQEARTLRDQYLHKNGHNMKGIGELGSSSESSQCSGFHNCRYGAKSIETEHLAHKRQSSARNSRGDNTPKRLSFSVPPQLRDSRHQSTD